MNCLLNRMTPKMLANLVRVLLPTLAPSIMANFAFGEENRFNLVVQQSDPDAIVGKVTIDKLADDKFVENGKKRIDRYVDANIRPLVDELDELESGFKAILSNYRSDEAKYLQSLKFDNNLKMVRAKCTFLYTFLTNSVDAETYSILFLDKSTKDLGSDLFVKVKTNIQRSADVIAAHRMSGEKTNRGIADMAENSSDAAKEMKKYQKYLSSLTSLLQKFDDMDFERSRSGTKKPSMTVDGSGVSAFIDFFREQNGKSYRDVHSSDYHVKFNSSTMVTYTFKDPVTGNVKPWHRSEFRDEISGMIQEARAILVSLKASTSTSQNMVRVETENRIESDILTTRMALESDLEQIYDSTFKEFSGILDRIKMKRSELTTQIAILENAKEQLDERHQAVSDLSTEELGQIKRMESSRRLISALGKDGETIVRMRNDAASRSASEATMRKREEISDNARAKLMADNKDRLDTIWKIILDGKDMISPESFENLHKTYLFMKIDLAVNETDKIDVESLKRQFDAEISDMAANKEAERQRKQTYADNTKNYIWAGVALAGILALMTIVIVIVKNR